LNEVFNSRLDLIIFNKHAASKKNQFKQTELITIHNAQKS